MAVHHQVEDIVQVQPGSTRTREAKEECASGPQGEEAGERYLDGG